MAFLSCGIQNVLALILLSTISCVLCKEEAPQINIGTPRSEIPYKEGEDIMLPCQADGNPRPDYFWKKDGQPLNVTGPHYSLQTGSGNLIIKAPSVADDGEYNCLARNRLGTAVGMKMRVQKAVIDPFPTVTEPRINTPVVGQSLTIHCHPPASYPKGNSYFGYNRPGSNKLENIANDDRVLLDYEGNLHFANVRMSDSLSDLGEKVVYVCVVHNALLGTYVQGGDVQISPIDVPGSPAYRNPRLMWPPWDSAVAIKGQTKKLKCIFGGLPTPKVTWRGRNKERFTVTTEGFGTEIEFKNVDLEDEGYYTCSANNSETGHIVSHDIRLSVKSPPFWSKNPPKVLPVDEESDAEIDCQVHGTPKPSMVWLINGEPAKDTEFRGRKSLDVISNKLRIHNVTVNDSQVIQCLASNEYGSILSNIVLKVNAEQPSFMKTPEDKKVVRGNSVSFQCYAQGAPKPKITWTRGKQHQPINGDRFRVLHTGDLEIQDAVLEDTDTYHCLASNKFGKNKASAALTVRSPTTISPAPIDRVVQANDSVVIPCDVKTDPAELSNLVVEWRQNGERIDFSQETHLFMNQMNFSLHIKSSKVKDTGSYTCHARNGLDSADSEVSKLRVKDRPEPPYNVDVFQCDATSAGVSWYVGEDNNDPITRFTIYYSNSISTWNITAGRNFQAGSVNQETVRVHPWSTYTFYVTATNGIGSSKPSLPTGKPCTTPQVKPYRNPHGVCGKLKAPRQLVIVWDPLPEEEHNGAGFHYVVGYKRHNSEDSVQEVKITDSKLGELIITDQEVFTPYQIYVQSANDIGKATLNVYEKKVTYSGEGKPLDAPSNFRLTGERNGSFAEFLWDHVDISKERIRGFFKGYRIKFWKSQDPSKVRTEDIEHDSHFDLCPSVDNYIDSAAPVTPARRRRQHHHRLIRSSSVARGSTSKLWPNSKISAGVMVLNQAQAGQLSNVINFETPEGVPEKVANLRIVERGSRHLRVEWQLPVETGGTIIGYQLQYMIASSANAKPIHKTIRNPYQMKFKITDLEHSTKYQIVVAAETAVGVGETESVIGITLPFGDPDSPLIGKIEPGENYANVSWIPSDKQPPVNPGSDFYVEYKKKDTDDTWKRVDREPNSDDNWVNVTDLEPGTYEVRVVAVTTSGDEEKETKSKTWIVFIGPDKKDPKPDEPESAPLEFQRASADWFIILMCIIALLLIILIIICILMRSRGDMYPVYEKEKMWRHHPLAPDETPFGEYAKPDESQNLSRSQGSLDSEEKPMESDSDSLGEYEDQDASKFNEDGSFIGLYSGKHKPEPSSTINTSV